MNIRLFLFSMIFFTACAEAAENNQSAKQQEDLVVGVLSGGLYGWLMGILAGHCNKPDEAFVWMVSGNALIVGLDLVTSDNPRMGPGFMLSSGMGYLVALWATTSSRPSLSN